MAKITITVEGEPEELRQTLLGLLGSSTQEWTPEKDARPPGLTLEPLPVTRDTTEERLQWTPELFREFWSGLHQNARQILAEIAHDPEGVDIAGLRKKLGIEPKALAGRLSPVGRAMDRIKKRHKKELPETYPYEADFSAGLYRMDPNIAQMVLNATNIASNH